MRFGKVTGKWPLGFHTKVVYALVDPDTNFVMYVGQTQHPKRRYKSHLYCGGPTSKDKSKWIADLLAQGKKPLMIILEEVFSPNAQEREAFWFDHYKELNPGILNKESAIIRE